MDHDRLIERIADCLGSLLYGGGVIIVKDKDELISTEPEHAKLIGYKQGESGGDLLQQNIPSLMP
ncbi:hypothetical protein D3C77_709610 [compost metagenome]